MPGIFFRMRTILSFILVAALAISSCTSNGDHDLSSDLVYNPNSASGNGDPKNLPVFEFEQDSHNFGKITQGERVAYSFRFVNKGKSDLLISNVSTACGCTVAEYPKNPIRPGEEGFVKVQFNSEGRKGIQNKAVIIVANTQPNTKVLRIKAQVILPESE